MKKLKRKIFENCKFKAGYIDTCGRGTLKIINSCKKAGLPTPEIIETAGGIQVTLFKELVKNHQVNEQVAEQVKKLLQCIDDKEYSNAELMHQLDIKHRSTFLYNYLQKALDLRFIEMIILDKPKSSKQKYRLTEKGIKLKESLKK